ncbi:MAG: AbrB/MazE/SpoVT family DNA-binding domain-containing protein [Anaerolineales bacterium]
MLRKIFKTGNSLVVSLPREVLEPLGLADGTDVSVELDRENSEIVIRRAGSQIPHGLDEEFARQVKEFIEEYRPALESLTGK